MDRFRCCYLDLSGLMNWRDLSATDRSGADHIIDWVIDYFHYCKRTPGNCVINAATYRREKDAIERTDYGFGMEHPKNWCRQVGTCWQVSVAKMDSMAGLWCQVIRRGHRETWPHLYWGERGVVNELRGIVSVKEYMLFPRRIGTAHLH